ncbi:MAG TPA: winged helix-turn-helix domain-containing protein [Candidatus Binataceae bacterium]|nr:winged helix-turn-helix domain-containing protein [Candidatus Binataceae bacterium]
MNDAVRLSTDGLLTTADLAARSDFALGLAAVSPSSRTIAGPGGTADLEPRVMQVLVVLADAAGRVVTRATLFDRCWGGVYVGDDSLNRVIGAIRKLASEIAEGSFEIETIPRTGYRLTSSNTVDDDPLPKSPAANNRPFRLVALAAAALVMLATAGAIFWIGNSNAPAHHSMRVAVEPFESLTNSGSLQSLAQKIPNEVVDALGDSQIPAVLGEEQASKKSLRAALIVTGTVGEDAANTSVDVRIEDAATQDALWSAEFKRDSREASDLPDEVAARVADVVNMIAFARTTKPALTDNSTLSALLQTTDMIRDSRGGDWAQLIEHAKGVVTRQPDSAFGHSLLAVAYAEAGADIDVPDRAKAMNDAARREAILTLRLDPEDAGAYAVLSDLEVDRHPYNYGASEAILLRGIKFARHPKEPLGGLYQYEGLLLANVGRLREALSFQLIAQATDPWSPSKQTRLALVYANMGNLPAARNALQSALKRWPNHRGLRSARLFIAAFYEQPADALAVLDRLDAQTLSAEDDRAIWRTFIEAKAERSAPVTASAIHRIRDAADQNTISRETEIMMFAQLGQTTLAVEAANAALDHHEKLQPWFLFTPVTRALREDPGFVALASRMGLIKYWRETGKRPDFCTNQATVSECSSELVAALKT